MSHLSRPFLVSERYHLNTAIIQSSPHFIMIQKFLIQVEFTKDTRWLVGNVDFMTNVLKQVQGVASGATEGPIPECSIMIEAEPALRHCTLCNCVLRSGLPTVTLCRSCYFTQTNQPRWLCSKCNKLWLCPGMHPDCDGEASDMTDVSSAA